MDISWEIIISINHTENLKQAQKLGSNSCKACDYGQCQAESRMQNLAVTRYWPYFYDSLPHWEIIPEDSRLKAWLAHRCERRSQGCEMCRAYPPTVSEISGYKKLSRRSGSFPQKSRMKNTHVWMKSLLLLMSSGLALQFTQWALVHLESYQYLLVPRDSQEDGSKSRTQSQSEGQRSAAGSPTTERPQSGKKPS